MGEQHEQNDSFEEYGPVYPAYIDELLTASPDAVVHAVRFEYHADIPVLERTIDNQQLCEEVALGLVMMNHEPGWGREMFRDFMTGMQYACTLARQTSMDGQPRLRAGFDHSGMTIEEKSKRVIGEAMAYSMSSDVPSAISYEMCGQLGLEQQQTYVVAHGILVGLNLINNGEREKQIEALQSYVLPDADKKLFDVLTEGLFPDKEK